MLMLGFASGLPFTVVGGTLAAWFTAKGVSTATIGILSWSALAYSFKFLWSPALHRTAAPFFARYGLRRGWFLPLQAIQVLLLLGFATLDPTTNLLAIAGLAVAASFISATFDIVLDAWRIETARNKDDVDALSTLVQAGYRSAAFVGGAGALILSDHMSWNIVIVVLALIMALTLAGSIIAPEPALCRRLGQGRARPRPTAASTRRAATSSSGWSRSAGSGRSGRSAPS